MEFPFDLGDILPGRITLIEVKESHSNITISDLALSSSADQEATNGWVYIQSSNSPWDLKVKRRKENLEIAIDKVGFASSQAQGLQSPITSLKKLISCNNQKIYTIRDINHPRCIIGMLKVGVKRLFVADANGAHCEVDPLCVLDFYVHESKQRCGYGHELYDAMLKNEGLHPTKLAIDRPSSKCLAFLKKHYNLDEPLLQNNNFIIYPEFLTNSPKNRPPIFLYNERVLQRCSNTASNNNSLNTKDVLSSFQVPVNDKDIKSKTFYSTVGNSLRWNSTPSSSCGTSYQTPHNKKPSQDPGLKSCRQLATSYWNKEKRDWGVHEALHSYASSGSNSECWSNRSTNCDMTPVDNMSSRQKKWNSDMQSSWNILGVKPLNYSSVHQHSMK